MVCALRSGRERKRTVVNDSGDFVSVSGGMNGVFGARFRSTKTLRLDKGVEVC